MFSNSLRALSFASLALTSFGCAAVRSSASPATPATVVEQASPAQAAAGYMSPTEGPTGAGEDAAPTTSPAPEAAVAEQPATESEGIIPVGEIRTIFGANGAAQGASLPGPLLHGEHKALAPVVADGAVTARGVFAPDVIQRIMRPGLGQAQMCYQNGLKRDPTLAGHINLVLTVGATGKVWLVRASKDSDLGDARVVSCVESSFYMVSFPRQEESVVKVTYPLVFGLKS